MPKCARWAHKMLTGQRTEKQTDFVFYRSTTDRENGQRSSPFFSSLLASKLIDAIDVGAEGLDEADHQQLMKLANEISEALDNIVG
jgi:hypothetical protein